MARLHERLDQTERHQNEGIMFLLPTSDARSYSITDFGKTTFGMHSDANNTSATKIVTAVIISQDAMPETT